MNSVPQHLHSEDRQEYERILDEALRSAPTRPELAAVGKRLNPEQLRTMALNATALITAAAATEYQHYVRVREEARQPASPTGQSARVYGFQEPGAAGLKLGGTLGEGTEPSHAKPGRMWMAFSRIVVAVLGFGRRASQGAVLPSQQQRMSLVRRLLAALLGVRTRRVAPRRTRTDAAAALAEKLSGCFPAVAILSVCGAAIATVLCLVGGYVLKAFGPASVAQTLVTTGWVCGAMTAAAILAAAVGLLLAALRNQSSPGSEPYGDPSIELVLAREAWHDALLERGILPFLQEALAAPGTAALRRTTPSAPSRMPNLGYDRPGFSSPDDAPEPGHRPSFTSPDFTNTNGSESE